MGTIKVHAGDFNHNSVGSFYAGIAGFGGGSFTLKTAQKGIISESIPSNELSSVQLASEENLKKLSGTLGWGAVGALALGPLGLLAGALVGGRKKEVTFIAEFKDGRRLLATTDNKTFLQIQAAAF